MIVKFENNDYEFDDIDKAIETVITLYDSEKYKVNEFTNNLIFSDITLSKSYLFYTKLLKVIDKSKGFLTLDFDNNIMYKSYNGEIINVE